MIRGERKVRKVMRKWGQRRKPIWITEATWPASKGKAPGRTRASWQKQWETGPVGMAKRLREVYKLLVARRRRERIGRVYWYTWATDYAGNDLFDYAGLLRWDGTTFLAHPGAQGLHGQRPAPPGLQEDQRRPLPLVARGGARARGHLDAAPSPSRGTRRACPTSAMIATASTTAAAFTAVSRARQPSTIVIASSAWKPSTAQ